MLTGYMYCGISERLMPPSLTGYLITKRVPADVRLTFHSSALMKYLVH